MYRKITIHRAPAFQVGHKNVIGLQLLVIIGSYSGSCSVICVIQKQRRIWIPCIITITKAGIKSAKHCDFGYRINTFYSIIIIYLHQKQVHVQRSTMYDYTNIYQGY